MKMKILSTMVGIGLMTIFLATSSAATEKPNIVLINMDNFGYGELGVYGGGILRGGATPEIPLARLADLLRPEDVMKWSVK